MQTMIDVWIQQGEERGLQKGEERGLQKGTAALTLKQLQWRFGLVDDATQAHIRALPLAQLKQLGEALLDFQKPNDLVVWLRQHTEQVA